MPRNIDENNPIPRHVQSELGIQRDGTAYNAKAYIDGQHCRFFHEWGEKMGGYKMLEIGDGEVINQMFGVSKSESTDIYMGRGSSLRYFNLRNNGTVGPLIDRTPTSGFTPNANNSWSFTLFSQVDPDTTEQTTYIIAQVNIGWNDVASQQNGPIFYGDIDDTTPLVQITNGQTIPQPVLVSGGVIALNNIIVAYGNNGVIYWTKSTIGIDGGGGPLNWCDIADVPNYQFIAQTKIVTAIEYYGTLLFWTLNSLLQAIYVPATGDSAGQGSYWVIKVISKNTSILSASCVVQYNQLVFWVGERQFYIFNGAVGRVQNYMAANWFFDNVNADNKSLTYAYVNEQYDEVWFNFPFGKVSQSFCNQNIIFNVGRQTWYTTQLDRSAGIILNTYRYPILSSSSPEITITETGAVYESYPVWSHENGIDKDINGTLSPIQSYFEYSIYDLYTGQASPNTNTLVQTMRVEPDFVMEGDMTLTIKNRMFAQSNAEETGPITFNSNTKFIDKVVSQGRQVTLRFESNTLGGYYQAGKILHDFIPGDVNV